jgi:uridine kinase
MLGDKIIIEKQHKVAGKIIGRQILHSTKNVQNKFTITIAGESGSGKSETATALSEFLTESGISNVILRQDDYFIYPPKTNNFMRRKDKNWRGMKEVKLDLLDVHVKAFKSGKNSIEKPLIEYDSNISRNTNFNFSGANILIVEGTYTSTLSNVDKRIFIDRNFHQTLEHRQNRNRNSSELDDFTKQVLQKEHTIISKHRALADIIINSDYSIEFKKGVRV